MDGERERESNGIVVLHPWRKLRYRSHRSSVFLLCAHSDFQPFHMRPCTSEQGIWTHSLTRHLNHNYRMNKKIQIMRNCSWWKLKISSYDVGFVADFVGHLDDYLCLWNWSESHEHKTKFLWCSFTWTIHLVIRVVLVHRLGRFPVRLLQQWVYMTNSIKLNFFDAVSLKIFTW